MGTTVSLDQSSNLKLIYRKGEGRPMTFRIREDGAAYDIGAFEFVFEVFEIDGTTPVFSLTEGSGNGIDNGGVTGLLVVDPSDEDVDIAAKSYHWVLRITTPNNETWFNGLFVVNAAPLRATYNDSATVELDLGDVTVDVALSISGTALPGTLRLMDEFDASVDTFPTTGGSGTDGAIQKGNMFNITVAGSPAGELLPVGTLLLALTDAPGQTATNWRIIA
jgi:hypothetical protein